MIPGEFQLAEDEIALNVGRKTVEIIVSNRGDRPVQVGSHYHFYEVNPILDFERPKALGMRLDIIAGTSVRFEPGQSRTVVLTSLAGRRMVYGFRGLIMGGLDGREVK